MISVFCSSNWLPEKKYIIDVIFTELLGLPYRLCSDQPESNFLIRLNNNKNLVIQMDLLDSDNDDYLTPTSLPEVTYIENQFTSEINIPLLFGNEHINVTEAEIHCGIDVFSSCFFMLSRLEEAIINEKDIHGRFSSKSSIAFKYNFLDRPVVDEYVEMLWNMLVYLDPELKRNLRKPKTFVTCDLDWPFDPIRRSLKKTILKSVADIVKRCNPSSSLMTWKYYFFHIFGIHQIDIFRDNIDWIMDVNEKAGNKVAFYFITKSTSVLDSNFDFSSSEMLELLRNIHSRGHEIGLHPGYHCSNDENIFKDSVKILMKAMKDADIKQEKIGGRMHFLRWDIKKTPQLWESHGFDYDSTLGYADQAGFRCGTSHEFTMFDLVNRKPLNLKQRPLINMDCTIISPRYEGLGYTDRALDRFLNLKKLAQKYRGNYTILWHNSHLSSSKDKEFYKELIK